MLSDDDDVIEALEELLEDVESVLENNDPLTYMIQQEHLSLQYRLQSVTVDTDEGVLEPLGVGEITLEIRY